MDSNAFNGESSHEYASLNRLAARHWFIFTTMLSLLLLFFSLPDSLFRTERYDASGVLLSRRDFRHWAYGFALLTFIYANRFQMRRIQLRSRERILLFAGIYAVAQCLIVWRVLPLFSRPVYFTLTNHATSISIQLLAVSMASFIAFDVVWRKTNDAKFVLRSIVEIVIVTPLWMISWAFIDALPGL